MRVRACVIGVITVLFVFSPLNVWAEHEQKSIDEVMSVKQKEIERAFSDFGRTRAVSMLAEIERMNEDAGSSLIEWWDESHMPCCMDKNSDIKKTWEQDRNKFTSYLKSICSTYTKIAGYYAENNMRQKARSLYQYVSEAFDSPEFARCTGEAKSRLEGFDN